MAARRGLTATLLLLLLLLALTAAAAVVVVVGALAAVDRDGAFVNVPASLLVSATLTLLAQAARPCADLLLPEPRYRVHAHADDLAGVEAATSDYRRVYGDVPNGEISLEVRWPPQTFAPGTRGSIRV